MSDDDDNAFYLSISDISTFKSCRQKWDFSSANRQSLRHRSSPRLYLTEGSVLHEALDAQAQGLDWRQVALDFIKAEKDRLVTLHEEANTWKVWDIELDEFDESSEFIMDLTAQYFDHYGTENPLSDQGLTYLATEVPFQLRLPLDGPNGEPIYFVGTWDGIAQDEDGNLFLVENKTYSSPPDSAELMWHDQSTGYAVVFHALTGERLTGMLYNGIAKRLIKPPKLLKNGKLSTDKRQSVTPKTYLEAMIDNEIDPFDDHYTEILEFLQEREVRGDTRFFYREKFYYRDPQLESWYEELLAVAYEMTHDPKIYRTVPFNGCGKSGSDCWYRDICRAKHGGGDAEWLLENKYTVGTYGTMNAMQDATVNYVASVESLKESLRGIGSRE